MAQNITCETQWITNWGLHFVVFWPLKMVQWLTIYFLAQFYHFWGQMPIFSCVTPTFLPLNSFLTWFFTSSERKNGGCRWKNSHLTPKTSLRLGFWSQMPFFPWVALVILSFSRFVIKFWLFSTIWDLSGPLWGQSWA